MITMPLLALLSGSADAARPRVVTLVVVDEQGRPIPNAEVRIPRTEGRRAVDPATGTWEASLVYERDGAPRIFERGTELELTVTAPGYRPRRLAYRVRGRRNVVEVPLEVLPAPSLLPDGTETVEQLMQEWFRSSGPDLTARGR